MTEGKFLSEKVREAFLESERRREQEVESLMREKGLSRDSAELEFYRAQHRQEKEILQRALTREEFLEVRQRDTFEFEGYVVKGDDLTERVYTHIKKVNADGVEVTIWAEEDEWESYDCTSPESVKCYRIMIGDYAFTNKGIEFSIVLTPTWTRERIMEEFDDVIEKVRERKDYDYFEMVYGNMNNVVFGGSIDLSGEDDS